LNFNDLFHSLSEASLSISNNSFGAHISSYLNIPVLAIYAGYETVSEFSPLFGKDFYILHTDTECSPCHILSKAVCLDNFSCLRDIKVEFVYRKIMEFISNGRIIETVPKLDNAEDITSALLYSIAEGCSGNIPEDLKLPVASCIEATFPPSERKKQLLIDITELRRKDAKTGIQRTVRNILYNVLINPPKDYEPAPVYFSAEIGEYFYAKCFVKRFMGEALNRYDYDPPLCARTGDIFLQLEPHTLCFDVYSAKIREMRNKLGIKLCFLVYDLLPVNFPRYFTDSFFTFHNYFLFVAEGDVVICISKATADDLLNWIQDCVPHCLNTIIIEYSHLGAGEDKMQIENAILSSKDKAIVKKITSRPTFLMVGTVEPRKAHRQTLAAFEKLWGRGIDVNLVIVGKNGWKMEDFAETLDSHKELGYRLFWLKGINDSYLEEIYNASACLIAASKAEGFGLPLIEAAKHKLPIIARDIPIFHEVAGDYAYYFSGAMPENLADAVIAWLELHKADQHPKSNKMPYLTWKESTENLIELVTKKSIGPLI
jgi:glycosyltransferase involved in cell wall biosynthesis